MKVRHTIRTAVVLALLALLAVGTTGCGGTDDSEQLNKKPGTKAERRDYRIQKEKVEAAKKRIKAPQGGWIKSVKLTPQKDESGTSIKIEAETAAPDEEKDERITYVFWCNNRKFAERGENVIPSSIYKRGDLVAAEVLFYRGDQLLAKKRSEPLLVENTAPVIQKVELPDISGPGIYSFKITADDEDGDQLTYTLSSPDKEKTLPQGFTIDNANGIITFKLAENQKMPPVLKFIINANDGGGGIAKKAVTLNFTSEKIIKKEEKKETPEPGEEKKK